MFLINILLVDDHILFAKSLAIALEEYDEIEDFYSVQDVHALAQTVRDRKTDIVLMDINLGKSNEIDGIKAAKDLLESIPDIKIIMLTGYDLPVYKHEARKLGIYGFLNKSISPDHLAASLLAVYHGRTCFPDEHDEPFIEDLTSMEKKILKLVGSGRKRKEIAQELYISERTLSNHLQHIYEKLDVTSSVEAITKALQMGYISITL